MGSGSSGERLIPSRPIIVLGRIGAPFGVKGWVHAQSFTDPERLLPYKTWQLLSKESKEGWVSYEVLAIRLQGKDCVAKLSGVETRDQAELLTHSDIGVFREELPELPENEYYWVDLIGLTVITDQDQVLGQVDRLFETGSNDVLVVKNEDKDNRGKDKQGGKNKPDGKNKQKEQQKEHWIPYIPGEYILEVNLKQKQIRVHWDPEF